jgi:hypothetical protein
MSLPTLIRLLPPLLMACRTQRQTQAICCKSIAVKKSPGDMLKHSKLANSKFQPRGEGLIDLGGLVVAGLIPRYLMTEGRQWTLHQICWDL